MKVKQYRMINVHELKAGNQVGFKLTIGQEIIYRTGAITAIEKDRVKIDELILGKKDLLPILLTGDTLFKLGCVQVSDRQWRTPDFINFEFDGIQVSFGYESAPTCYLHVFQNIVSLAREEFINV